MPPAQRLSPSQTALRSTSPKLSPAGAHAALTRWVHAARKLHAETLDPFAHKYCRQRLSGPVAGFVEVVGDQHPPRTVEPEGGEAIGVRPSTP